MNRTRTAILADIDKYNLDPNVAHRGTFANGHLAKTAIVSTEAVVEAPAVKVQVEVIAPTVESTPVVELVAEPIVEPVVETLAEDEPKVDEDKAPDSDESKVVESVTKKKGKKQPTE